ncbi:MAG: hypothetical protein QHH14_14165 [Clostridiales bacterium]|nr:hypothetical protein [Clostridiales bacterium]
MPLTVEPESMQAVTDYKADLNQRYWEYQKSQFGDWQRFFERPYAQDGRPPVFLEREVWRNVIINPAASQREISRLLALVPEPDRHKWFRSMNSSQALAQSILGNLAIYDILHCLTELQDDDGQSLFGNAQMGFDNFAMEFKVGHLGEPRPTSLDAYVFGSYRVAIECKFTEADVGTCSRPRLTPRDTNYESEHCDGTYSKQRGRRERCPLTEIGVLYWRYVPHLFRWQSDSDLSPCPLNRNYQLVRNILAVSINADGTVSLEGGHVVLMYDERNPAFQEGGDGLAAYRETRAALRQPTMLRRCSWQRIIQHLRHKGFLSWLTEHLTFKYGL